VHQIITKTNLDDLINSKTDGAEFLVGDNGNNLSGGQIQRIAIARALYKEADVIVFDEATSALDNLTEKAVMNAIENLNPNITIIIVAHRLSTLRNCNEIIELKDGKIFRKGNYKDIIE
jgi:ATP-binding cassette subfamily B protein